MRRLIVPTANLVLGAACAGCGRPALALCRTCGAAIRPEPRTVWPRRAAGLEHPSPVPPVASGEHAGTLRTVIVGWKEEGVTRLTEVLAHHVAASVAVHADRPGPLTLVPVPTSRRSRRARGGDLVDELARSAGRLLTRTGLDVTVVQALSYVRTTQDQAGLGADARRANLAGALTARPDRLVDGRRVVVVDDVMTTGSTLEEAVRALSEVGRRPVGVAVVAATPWDS